MGVTLTNKMVPHEFTALWITLLIPVVHADSPQFANIFVILALAGLTIIPVVIIIRCCCNVLSNNSTEVNEPRENTTNWTATVYYLPDQQVPIHTQQQLYPPPPPRYSFLYPNSQQR